jgi:hypothetical protein
VRDDSQQPNEPERLADIGAPLRRASGASELERRLLGAAAGERPNADMQRRMRAALGLSAGGVVTAAAATATATTAATAKAGAGTGIATGASGWLSTGIVAAVVAGGVVATVVSVRAPNHDAKPAIARPAAPAEESPAPVVRAPRKVSAPAASRRHVTPAPAASDLRGEIALVDAARTAIRASVPERALSLLDHYRKSYPHGAFAPEASVLRIEALDAAGRTTEARTLARAFLTKHPDSPLADRVAPIARR